VKPFIFHIKAVEAVCVCAFKQFQGIKLNLTVVIEQQRKKNPILIFKFASKTKQDMRFFGKKPGP
jgi:hypothetical protein